MASNHSEDTYDMHSLEKSLLVVFCFEKFHPRLNLEQREGTHQDCQGLCKLFETTYGFESEIHHDLERTRLLLKFEGLKNRKLKNRPSLVLAFLSHGNQRGIFARDGLFELKDVIQAFNRDNCYELKGKPKIILVQVQSITMVFKRQPSLALLVIQIL